MDKFISIREASLMIGVTTTTLRRWEENGLFSPNHRTLGNHRRYLLKNVLNLINPRTNNESKTFEEELASDVLEIITVFSAKLYGSRSHKNKKMLKRNNII